MRELSVQLGRSVLAMSRLYVNRIVLNGLFDRRKDDKDRWPKRLGLTLRGRTCLRNFERSRAEAQFGVMTHLSPEEQQLVSAAMALFGKAARRYACGHNTAGE